MSSKIIGHVLDNNQRPVNKVKISLKGKIVAVSKEDGFFSVALAKTERRAALTFMKEGFVSNTKVFNSKSQSKRIIIIWPIAYQCRFNPSHDLDIVLGGSRIQVPANTLVGIDGKKIKDSARLQFTWFDVTNQFHRVAASGDFTGKMLDGNITRLNSYGIFDLGFYDQKDRFLKLRPEAVIDLSIPVPPKLIKQAPKSVGFFSFDTSSGIWIQLGNFDFIPKTHTYNGSYKPKPPYGAHNLDNPQDTTCVTIQVVRMWDNAPMPNFYVVAHGESYDSWGTTDANGFVCLLVQRNASFTAESSGSIGSSDYGTPYPATFTAPDFSSCPNDCGNPVLCPFLGTVQVDLIVGVI